MPEVSDEQIEAAGKDAKKMLKAMGMEELADDLTAWYKINRRKMTAQELLAFLSSRGGKK